MQVKVMFVAHPRSACHWKLGWGTRQTHTVAGFGDESWLVTVGKAMHIEFCMWAWSRALTTMPDWSARHRPQEKYVSNVSC